MTRLSVVARANGTLGRSRSLWRSRAALFALLGILLLASSAVLVVYHVFYDARLAALGETRANLTARRDEAKAGADRAAEAERRLLELKKSLDTFYGDVLGTRKARLAPIVEDVYAITAKAGFQPPVVNFVEDAIPGADRTSVSFQVDGRYADIKSLLHAFESSPAFLVLERVQVSLDENTPDVLRVVLSVSHYFRGEGPRAPKRPSGTPVRAAAPAKPPAPSDAAEKLVIE